MKMLLALLLFFFSSSQTLSAENQSETIFNDPGLSTSFFDSWISKLAEGYIKDNKKLQTNTASSKADEYLLLLEQLKTATQPPQQIVANFKEFLGQINKDYETPMTCVHNFQYAENEEELKREFMILLNYLAALPSNDRPVYLDEELKNLAELLSLYRELLEKAKDAATQKLKSKEFAQEAKARNCHERIVRTEYMTITSEIPKLQKEIEETYDLLTKLSDQLKGIKKGSVPSILTIDKKLTDTYQFIQKRVFTNALRRKQLHERELAKQEALAKETLKHKSSLQDMQIDSSRPSALEQFTVRSTDPIIQAELERQLKDRLGTDAQDKGFFEKLVKRVIKDLKEPSESSGKREIKLTFEEWKMLASHFKTFYTKKSGHILENMREMIQNFSKKGPEYDKPNSWDTRPS